MTPSVIFGQSQILEERFLLQWQRRRISQCWRNVVGYRQLIGFPPVLIIEAATYKSDRDRLLEALQ